MKVLKKGRKKKVWTKEVTCSRRDGRNGCGARLLVGKEDLFVTREKVFYRYDRDWGTESVVKFRCPECGVETEVKAEVPFSPSELPKRSAWLAKGGKS